MPSVQSNNESKAGLTHELFNPYKRIPHVFIHSVSLQWKKSSENIVDNIIETDVYGYVHSF